MMFDEMNNIASKRQRHVKHFLHIFVWQVAKVDSKKEEKIKHRKAVALTTIAKTICNIFCIYME